MVGLQAYTLHVAEKHVTSTIMRCRSIEPGMDFPFKNGLAKLETQLATVTVFNKGLAGNLH